MHGKQEDFTIKESLKHDYLNVGDIKLHYVESGSGKLVILLHGFPDFWYSWRHQIPALAKSFRVVAPDLRGYNKSDKPEGVENYTTSLLVQDIRGLIDALGETNATIVGHDWGGVVAWNLAMMAPEKVSNLVIINCPHPVPLLKAFWSMRFQQLQKSWYVFFFQTPKVPEELLSRNNCKFLQKMILGSVSDKKTFNEEDMQLYVEAWSQPGALTASVNYYRANWNPAQILSMPEDYQAGLIQRFPKIKCPTLVIWGEKDVALEKSLTVGVEEHIGNACKIQYFPEYGHWVHNEAPDAVNRTILSFLE
ncbi:MAG: alpha/beta fold hydrolase [Candidatus Hodarchaeales archaeon]